MNQRADDLFIGEVLKNWKRLSETFPKDIPAIVQHQLQDNDRAIKILEDRKK